MSVFIVFVITLVTFTIATSKEGHQPVLRSPNLEVAAPHNRTGRYDGGYEMQFVPRPYGFVNIYRPIDAIGMIHPFFRNPFYFNSFRNNSAFDRPETLTFQQTGLQRQCQLETLICDWTSKYRSMNGTCNNIKNPHWGSVFMPNNRLLPPTYHGNTDEPRGGLKSTTLPSARTVSLAVHAGNGYIFEREVTHMIAQFGQFLDHDFTNTPVVDKDCCSNPTPDDDCFSIVVEQSDPHYRSRMTCMDFVRSTPSCLQTPSRQSTGWHREQFNSITAYIDGSVVYGSNEEVSQKLRSHRGGKLVENSDRPGLLPWMSDVDPNGSFGTFAAGDTRVGEMPGLTVMHTLFLREHNRIATALAKIRYDWDDEKLFQVTRRIIAAELQQIAFSEFLPTVLGPAAMRKYDLELPQDVWEFTTYDDTVDATIFSAFSTAAFRFGHSLVNGLIQLFLDDVMIGSYELRESFNRVEPLFQQYNGTVGFDLILNGLIHQQAQACDAEVHSAMTNDLFMNRPSMLGSDLAAKNIQRGRDHGLPSYSMFREFCDLAPLKDTWATGRTEDISEQAWRKLKSVYRSPLDIDLFTGGLSETAVTGGLTGPTFGCLLATQFQRLMKGDRFFFTHANVSGSFTRKQLACLRGRTLGDIICQNSVAIRKTARSVFHVHSNYKNPIVSCDARRRQLDLTTFAVDE